MKILEKIKLLGLLGCFLLAALIIYLLFLKAKSILAVFSYTPAWNVGFGWAIFAISTLVFIKGLVEYIKTSDKRMALIACGIFTAGLFEIMHLIHSTGGSFQLIYSTLSNFCYAYAGISSLFYLAEPYEEGKKHFFADIFAIHLIFFGLATLFAENIVTKEFTDKYFALSGTEMIWAGSFFLIALIYANIRKKTGFNPFSFFSFGYFFLFLNEIYIPTSSYFGSAYRLFIHLATVLGLLFIYIGLKDIQIKTKRMLPKLKSFIPPYLALIAIYTITLLLSSDAFKVLVPQYLQYYFLVFFIILTFSETKEPD